MIEYSENFLHEAKALSKKYKRLKEDIKAAVHEIEAQKDLGTFLGHGMYTKRDLE